MTTDSDTTTPPLTVGQAIAEVMRRMPDIPKGDTAPGNMGGFAYRGIESMTRRLQPILADVGLVIVPQARTIVFDHAPGQKEAWQDVTMQFDWLLVGPDGSTLTASTCGIGRDHTDKGANKAQTQAYKYLLMHLLCVADGKDDADGHDYTAAVAEPVKADPRVGATYSRLVSLAGDTEASSALKEWAHGMDRKLTEKALAEDEGWLLAVDAKLREYEVAPAADIVDDDDDDEGSGDYFPGEGY